MTASNKPDPSKPPDRASRPLPSWRFMRAAIGVVAVVGLVAGIVAIASSSVAGTWRPITLAHVTLLSAIIVGILGVARYGGEGYLAALWVFAPLAPVVAAVVSVVSYLLLPDPGAAVPSDPAVAVYLGLSAALATWLLSGFPGAALASRDRAQLRVYNQLVQRHAVLAARATSERDRLDERPDKRPPRALLEAETCLDYVCLELHDPARAGPALRWALSSGYTGLTRQLHRAEEALIAIEPSAELIGDVLHDDLSLEDSGIRNRFALRRVIRDALPAISSAAAQVLLRPVPALPSASTAAAASDGAEGAGTTKLTPADAREALREVRFAINEYRDDLVDSFARGRNRVLWTYLAVSISTYAFLGLGLIFGIPRSALISVSVLYLVGSLVGLFSRLRIEASNTPRVEDYGVFIARLLTGPLLSGLAGVAGVYLIAQAPAFLGPLTASTTPPTEAPQPKDLVDIYSLTENQLAILVAAVFGLAPGTLTSRLQGQVNRLERDLARSEPATSPTSSEGAQDEPSEDEEG